MWEFAAGDELLLSKPSKVLVEARVRFDPSRDDVLRLQIIQNGSVIKSYPNEIACKFELEIAETSWLAGCTLSENMLPARAFGEKKAEGMKEEIPK